MAILTFEQRHDLGKTLLFCPSKIYSALYVHNSDFRTNFNMSTSLVLDMKVLDVLKYFLKKMSTLNFNMSTSLVLDMKVLDVLKYFF